MVDAAIGKNDQQTSNKMYIHKECLITAISNIQVDISF